MSQVQVDVLKLSKQRVDKLAGAPYTRGQDHMNAPRDAKDRKTDHSRHNEGVRYFLERLSEVTVHA